jgi:hypothetical protein
MIQQRNESTLGTSVDIRIEAVSSDPVFNKTSKTCIEATTVQVVDKGNMTIWKTGITVPEAYYMNYPGRLEIFLQDYVVGPNITFSVIQTMVHYDLPPHQQNHSTVNMTIANITFFYTEVIP